MTRVITPHRVREEGLSRSGLYRAVSDGAYERIARGVYLPADQADADWDMLEAATHKPQATICLLSALAMHDLVDDIPDHLDVALPRPSRKPVSTGALHWHIFDRDTFSIGRNDTLITGTDHRIGVYSPERSIIDAFRLRALVGYETSITALKNWLSHGGKPGQLINMAGQIPRAQGPLRQALEILA